MRNLFYLVGSVLLVTLVLVFSAGTTLAADAMPESELVKVLLENDDVKVAKANRPPGTVVPMHTHPAYVGYIFAPWKGRFTNPEGKVVEKEFSAGDVLYSPGRTHALEIIGTTNQEILVIEWKKK
jgi:anti-sigma factor ChrR (cupin superfamily)